MFDNSKEYIPISSSIFFEGMFIKCDIYYKVKNDYIFVFQGAVLSAQVIQKLKKIEFTYGSLYVNKAYIDSLVSQHDTYLLVRAKLEATSEYTKINQETRSLFDYILNNDTIPKNIAIDVSKSIVDKVETIDASIIIQLINHVRTSDEYLYSHSTNVAFINGLMGKWLKLSEADTYTLVLIGLLHDIGKIKVPLEILNKPGVLTHDEFEIIKLHPVHSYEMLIMSGETNDVILKAVRGHHEKMNGTGYPDGLNSENISLFARITTISDIYDAMITKRVYKDFHSPFEILCEFSKGKFSNLDMSLVNTFLENMPMELLGKNVLLSNGEIGTVVYISKTAFCYPMVKVNQEIIQTNDIIKCISMCE